MSELWRFRPTPGDKTATVRAAEVAGAQWGVIGTEQLVGCGISQSTVSRWDAAGRLHLMYPGVYALGHPSVPIEGRLVAALLHAGEGSVLSHTTAAWVWGLLDELPEPIRLSTPRRIRSPGRLVVHGRRQLETTRHRRFPITALPQTFLDLAATVPLATVRRALAEADYRGLLDPEAVAAIAGRGRPGSSCLRQALKQHQPRLAHTRSLLEVAFLSLCESAGLPLPELNVRISGWTVDAVWRAQRVVVELDGYDNHRSPGQLERDRRKELALRAAGFLALRYTWYQVTEEGGLVIADLSAGLRV